eukprot:10720573-Alexandrium_andersonii.AAC.1
MLVNHARVERFRSLRCWRWRGFAEVALMLTRERERARQRPPMQARERPLAQLCRRAGHRGVAR